jgi:uracil-DNA glycosylase family 4
MDDLLKLLADRIAYEAAFGELRNLPGYGDARQNPTPALHPSTAEPMSERVETETAQPPRPPEPLQPVSPEPDSHEPAKPMPKKKPTDSERPEPTTGKTIRVRRDPVPLDAGPDGMPRVSNEEGSSTERLARLAAWTAKCERCPLCETRTQVVFGVGRPDARLLIVGEAPGADEDAQGEPFVGRAGKKLNEIIGAMGLAREDVFICNILKCRPPKNRDPNPLETETCTPILEEQIATVRPEVMVTLGAPATKYMLGTTDPIGKLRGRFHYFGDIPLMPTYHPAYLLRSYTPENRKRVWDDMQLVMQQLGLSQ